MASSTTTAALNRRTAIVAGGLAAAAALTGCMRTGGRADTAATRAAAPEMTTTPVPSDDAGVLLVFFSRPGENYWEGGRRDLTVGNTKTLARKIAGRIECDTYEILAADPYPKAYDPTVARNAREQEADARPAIAGGLPDVSRYDMVLLGSPVWNVRVPMIMQTFVASVDLRGKTILPFVTYAVSGMAGLDDDYRQALPDSDVRAGLAVRGEEARDAAADVEQWLRGNGLR